MPDEGDIAQEKYERFLEARIAEHRHRTVEAGLKPAPTECIDCGEVIPEKRRKAVPGCVRCIECQKAFEEGR